MILPYQQRNLLPYRAMYQGAQMAGYGGVGAVAYQAAKKAMQYAYSSSRNKGYQRYQKSNKRYKARKQKIPRKAKTIKAKVKRLERKVNSNISEHVYRSRTVNALIAAVNVQNSSVNNMITNQTIDNAIANLRYFDPATPGTLLTADVGASTYNQSITIKSMYSNATIRNNYAVPLYLKAYVCEPKVDTSISPLSAWTNGLADQGNPSATFPCMYPSDSDQFNELWKITALKKVFLQPGQQVEVSHSSKRPFIFDPSLEDSHPSTYNIKWSPAALFCQVSGAIAHDSALDEQGSIGCGIDILIDTTIKVSYNSGGPKLKDFTVSNASATPTNGFLCANKPDSNNQGYNAA